MRRVQPTPTPDAYTDHPLVYPHFASIPPLTDVSAVYSAGTTPTWRINPRTVDYINDRLFTILRRHELTPCAHLGLYVAGCAADCRCSERERIWLLVVELHKNDIGRWAQIDEEVKLVLSEVSIQTEVNLSLAARGVCVRYYQMDATATERDAVPDTLVQDQQIAWETGDPDSATRTDHDADTEWLQLTRTTAAFGASLAEELMKEFDWLTVDVLEGVDPNDRADPPRL